MVIIHLLTIIFRCEEVEFHLDHNIENCMSISLTVLPFHILCINNQSCKKMLCFELLEEMQISLQHTLCIYYS
jgi:hypothetical protein